MMRQAVLSVRALTALENRLWSAGYVTRLSFPAQADAATPSHDGSHARCFSTPAAFRVRQALPLTHYHCDDECKPCELSILRSGFIMRGRLHTGTGL